MQRFGLASELTRLNSLSGVFLKRDDELSFGVSGSKWRKLATLVPHLLRHPSRPVWLVGGLASNSVVAAAQVFREAGLNLRVLIPSRSASAPTHSPNAVLSAMILGHADIKRGQPAAVPAAIAALRQLAHLGVITWLDEGLDHPAAYPGAASLAADLHRNEDERGERFRHVVIDAGTGVSAAAMILNDARHLRGTGFRRHYHVVLIAGDEAYFGRQWAKVARILPGTEGLCPGQLGVEFYRPDVGKSFGSTPAAVFATIRKVARQDGVLLDPIYTAKTYEVLARRIAPLPGAKVMIHTGGGLSLGGFLDRL